LGFIEWTHAKIKALSSPSSALAAVGYWSAVIVGRLV
jgi:hypothetical protein